MAENSTIQWTHHTFNPWRGCTKVSPGCANCYAEAGSRRNPAVLGVWGAAGRRSVAAESYWDGPPRWARAAALAGERHRVFCASLADVFEGRDTMPRETWYDVEAARARLFRLIDATPELDWLLLTKRPENVADMWHSYCPSVGSQSWGHSSLTRRRFRRENVWLGCSVEDQERAEERIPHLLRCRDLARVLYLSCEPLLGEVDLTNPYFGLFDERPRDSLDLYDLPGGEPDELPCPVKKRLLDWVIVGGESGPLARPFALEWCASLVRQCAAAGVPCFVKQMGHRPTAEGELMHLGADKGGDPGEWPQALRVRQFPEAVAC
jgi:protein gp37